MCTDRFGMVRQGLYRALFRTIRYGWETYLPIKYFLSTYVNIRWRISAGILYTTQLWKAVGVVRYHLLFSRYQGEPKFESNDVVQFKTPKCEIYPRTHRNAQRSHLSYNMKRKTCFQYPAWVLEGQGRYLFTSEHHYQPLCDADHLSATSAVDISERLQA